MTTIQTLAVQTALAKLFEQPYFDVCTIESILKITKTVPNAEDYAVLHAIHCVHYNKMPRALRDELPQLISRMIGCEIKPVVEFKEMPDSEPEAVKPPPGFFRRLLA